MSILKQVSYYDSETGECVRDSSLKELNEPKALFKNNYRYSKTYHIEKPDLSNKTFYYYFYECIANLEQGTNRIVFFGNSPEDNKPINMKEFSEICGISRQTASAFFKECADKMYIRRLDLDGEFFGYFLNPKYAFNGKYIDSILYLMFSDCQLRDYLEEFDFFKMQEYVSFNNIKTLANVKLKK